MLLSEDVIKLQIYLDRLNNSVDMFGLRFVSHNRKIMSKDWMGSKIIGLHK